MTRKITAPSKTGLHFEKIPVADIGKKIAPDNGAKRPKGRTKDLTAEPPPRRAAGAAPFHGVQFYNDPDALCRIVGGFVGEGLEDGGLALVVATPDHAARIDACLRARGIDVEAMKRKRNLITLDAREMLQLFMLDGLPHPGMFRRVVSSALTRLGRGREQCTIRAYGEMVDLLWKEGLEAAAIRLETLWNQFGTTHDFKLLCGYSMGNFYKEAAIEEICDQHSHRVAGSGAVTHLPDVQEGSVTSL